MRLLLDTHILLAAIENRIDSFDSGIRRLLEEPAGEFHASVASLWEIAIKQRLGKLRLTPRLNTLPELLDGVGIEIVPINERHVLASDVLASVEPEPRTRDPFDRLLLAQCKIEDLRLVTIDRALVAHPLAAKAT
ncbi:MAG: type II toxin-antitoxin system VapC family toxin [Methylocystis sp.]|nr:type II toxin-antitoxin system VapC family toxin [Methylocystis sp.]MBI3275977.1 type II toxin-antitoxin system VapC family toxin [Methylocystis sp.]